MLLGGKIFSPIRHDIKVKTAQVKRKTITEAFPATKASVDARAVVSEIMDEINSKESLSKPQKEKEKINEASL